VIPLPLALINAYWFAPPLIVAISLVYAASRHEDWGRIWRHALRLFLTITLLLVLATVLLLLINTQI